MEHSQAYGATRERRANISYAEVERAALAMLATERRPSGETVRQKVGPVWSGAHAKVDPAALDLLATERRPSVETVREHLGRGSPATIATSLKRFWRDLGVRAAGDPAALTRIPSRSE